jgi:hypothetical protein
VYRNRRVFLQLFLGNMRKSVTLFVKLRQGKTSLVTISPSSVFVCDKSQFNLLKLSGNFTYQQV